jgi:hypothetical protein
MSPRTAFRASGTLTGLMLLAGLLCFFAFPGGGRLDRTAVTDFYTSGSVAQNLVIISVPLLMLASWAGTWFLLEWRALLPGQSRLGEVGVSVGRTGAVVVGVGAAVAIGLLEVQKIAGGDFVGIPIATTLAQSGLSAMVLGFLSWGLALVLLGVTSRRTGALARGSATAAVVVGTLQVFDVVLSPVVLVALVLLVIGLRGVRTDAPAPHHAARRHSRTEPST